MKPFREACSALLCSSGVVLTLVLGACGGGDPAGAADAPVAASLLSSSRSSGSPAPAAAAFVAPDPLFVDTFEFGMPFWSNWGNAQVVDGEGVSGSRALRVGTGAGGAGFTELGVIPGETYTLRAQVRVSDPAQGFYLGIDMVDASGQLLAQQAVPVTATTYGVQTLALLAPAGSANAVVFVWKNAGSGYGYVDDVQLVRGVALPPPVAAANLLSNPGFEAGMTSWVDWGNTLVLDGTGVSGSRALRVGAAAGGAGQEVGGIVAGAAYQLSAQVRVSDASEVAYIGVTVLDAAGSVVAQQASPFSGTSVSTASLQVTAPVTAARALVFVWKNGGSGYAFLDDFVFARADGGAQQPAGTNLVVNPGFENLLAGWSVMTGTVAIDGDAASGTYALRIGSGVPQPGRGSAVEQYIQIVPGQHYTLSGQGKVSDLSQFVTLSVEFLDDLGLTVGPYPGVIFLSTTWSSATTDFVAPSNARTVHLMIGRLDANGFGYADNVSLIATPAPSF